MTVLGGKRNYDGWPRGRPTPPSSMRSNNVEMKMEGKEVIAFGVYSPRAKDTL